MLPFFTIIHKVVGFGSRENFIHKQIGVQNFELLFLLSRDDNLWSFNLIESIITAEYI